MLSLTVLSSFLTFHLSSRLGPALLPGSWPSHTLSARTSRRRPTRMTHEQQQRRQPEQEHPNNRRQRTETTASCSELADRDSRVGDTARRSRS